MTLDELRQPSTHLGREKRGKDARLEELLEAWGMYRAHGLHGLSLSGSTPIAVAMEMRNAEAPIRSDKPQPKQTRVVLPVVPQYYTHRLMNQVDRVVADMLYAYRRILALRYEYGLDGVEIAQRMRWKHRTYWTRMSEARKIIKENVRF